MWTIGYSPDVVVGVWGGNNDDTPMIKKIAGLIIAPLWSTLMTEAVASTTASDVLKKPTPIDGPDAKPIFRGIWQGGQTYTIDTVSGKLATQYTPPETQKEVAVTDVHSILYWVDKNDPQGPPPTDPSSDPQFNNWEAPVRAWAASQGLTDQSSAVIPTATDDVHVPANFPQINLTGWDPNKVYEPGDTATINFSIANRFPIQKILVYGNNGILGTISPDQRSFSFKVSNIDDLSVLNNIQIIVTDSVFDQATASTSLAADVSQSSQ
ncbi:MAG TPA: hypothetical protein VMR73_00725 [Candidatus Paceibacterota bacterium]|nr:hypothetical protein [Candidatus Paceibacterota bacterium]